MSEAEIDVGSEKWWKAFEATVKRDKRRRRLFEALTILNSLGLFVLGVKVVGPEMTPTQFFAFLVLPIMIGGAAWTWVLIAERR
jgi:hypothetical protein